MIFLGVLFIGYSQIIAVFKNNFPIKNLIPFWDLQLVYPIFSSHNHLGDFIGIVLIGVFYFYIKENKKIYLIAFLGMLPFFISAFSRSAYIAFTLVLFYLLLTFKKVNKQITALTKFIGVIIFFVIITTTLIVTFKIKKNDPLSGRPGFIMQSLKSFQEKPLFGYGPGNFYNASLKNNLKGNNTTVYAHNIFLEILVDSGLLAVIFFGLFILLILRQAFKHHSLFTLGFLYFLINFQMDVTYKIYGLLVLFIITAGLSYQEEKKWNGPTGFGLLSLIPSIAVLLITTGAVLLKAQNPELAISIYPLNKAAYQALINKYDSLDRQRAENLALQLSYIAPGDVPNLLYLANFYKNNGNKIKELEMLERAYRAQNILPFDNIKQIYILKKKTQSILVAQDFIRGTLIYFKQEVPQWLISKDYRKQIKAFCRKYEKDICKKTGWK